MKRLLLSLCLVLAVSASALAVDRMIPIQGSVLNNTTQTSAANASNVIAVAPSPSTRWMLRYAEATIASSSSCFLIVQDASTVIFFRQLAQPQAISATASNNVFAFPDTGLSGSASNVMTVSISPCGLATTSTMNVIMDRVQ